MRLSHECQLLNRVCQDRIHQKCVMPYLLESRSDKLVAFEADDESIVSRKDLLLRRILRTIEAGVERQELKET